MFHLTRLGKLFSRSKKPSKQDLENIDELRERILKQIVNRYQLPDQPHKDLIYEQRVYGKQCNIIGMTPDSHASTTLVQNAIVALKPTHVILGMYNYQNMTNTLIPDPQFRKNMKMHYQNALSADKLFCKSRITQPILNILNDNINFIVKRDEQNNVRSSYVLKMDHMHKRVTTDDYLTIMNLVIERQLCKLSFGKPSDLVVFEDIMLNVELDQLWDICRKVIDSVRANKMNQFKFYPINVCEEIVNQARNHRRIFQKQLVYSSALLNKYCTTSQKPMLFVPHNFVEYIAQNVHNTYINPQTVFNRNIDLTTASESSQKLFGKYLGSHVNKQKAMDEIMQKFAILSMLKNNVLEIDLIFQRDNFFKRTMFRPLFDKIPTDQLIARYQAIRAPIKKLAGDTVFHRLQRIEESYQDNQKQVFTLPEQLKTQQQRIYDFPTNYVIENRETRRTMKKDIAEMKEQMNRIANQEYNEEDRQFIKMHNAGRATKQSVILMDKLMVQAKIRLKKQHLKLPNFHYAAMRGIFKHQIKQNLLKGEDRMRMNKKMTLNKFLEEMKNHPESEFTQITDPQEMKKYLYGDKGDGMTKFNLCVDENGEITENGWIDVDGTRSWRDDPSSVTIQQMLKQMDKDPFFSEYRKQFEAAPDNLDPLEDQDLDADIEDTEDYKTNKYYREQYQKPQPKSKRNPNPSKIKNKIDRSNNR